LTRNVCFDFPYYELSATFRLPGDIVNVFMSSYTVPGIIVQL